LALSSPLIGVEVEVPEVKKWGAKYLAKYLPKLTMWNEIKNNVLSRDKKILEEFDRDLLRHDRVSAGLYLEMMATAEKIQKMGKKIDIPTYFQLAGQDKVVSTKASKKFFETLGSQDKKITIYENSYHEIYNDLDREKVFGDLREWLKTHLL
jgi:alpha-beta hydrolase superfamily lysophospholipase